MPDPTSALPARLRNGRHQPFNIYAAGDQPGDDDEQLGYVRDADVAQEIVRRWNEVGRLRAVADITDAATAYVEADPDRDDVPQLWEELRGAVGHYRAVQARRQREPEGGAG